MQAVGSKGDSGGFCSDYSTTEVNSFVWNVRAVQCYCSGALFFMQLNSSAVRCMFNHQKQDIVVQPTRHLLITVTIS